MLCYPRARTHERFVTAFRKLDYSVRFSASYDSLPHWVSRNKGRMAGTGSGPRLLESGRTTIAQNGPEIPGAQGCVLRGANMG